MSYPGIKNRKYLLAVLMILLPAILLNGCGDNTDPEDSDAPGLPLLSSFLMDFSDFLSAAAQMKSVDNNANAYPPSKQHWDWATINVVVWSAAVTIVTTVPAAAFAESFNHNPVQSDSGTWVWSYSFTANNLNHDAELHGKIVNSEIQWKMYISKENSYADFLWYTGASNLILTEGTWTLYKDPNDRTPFIEIEWHRNLLNDTGDIKYMNIIPGDPENGGYIFYGKTTDPVYDAFYNIYNKGKDNNTDIEWNRATKVGQVRDPRHFGDTVWYRWDEYQNDIY